MRQLKIGDSVKIISVENIENINIIGTVGQIKNIKVIDEALTLIDILIDATTIITVNSTNIRKL